MLQGRSSRSGPHHRLAGMGALKLPHHPSFPANPAKSQPTVYREVRCPATALAHAMKHAQPHDVAVCQAAPKRQRSLQLTTYVNIYNIYIYICIHVYVCTRKSSCSKTSCGTRNSAALGENSGAPAVSKQNGEPEFQGPEVPLTSHRKSSQVILL